ncbi:MAG: SAM-dependent methyltransferase [Pseudomonadota bacterium]
MTPLEARLRADIATNGPIPVPRYMELCLTDPAHGYYMRGDPIGAGGDFVTAPEVSQMFGEIIGAWLMTMFFAMGSHPGTRLVELGPGRGTLMADILRVFALREDATSALEVVMVEASPALREKQAASLASWPGRKTWIGRLEDLPPGPMLLVGNEFLDALPIRQFVKMETGLHERGIGLGSDDALAFLPLSPIVHPDEIVTPPLNHGDIFERGEAACAAVRNIARRLGNRPGYALFIDYGYDAPGAGDTLQAVHDHKTTDPLSEPGLNDLTSHVCFGALREAARMMGAEALGPMSQAAFLSQLGISLRADALIKDAPTGRRAGIEADLARLVSPDQMGALFKAMTIWSPGLPVPPPFQETSTMGAGT